MFFNELEYEFYFSFAQVQVDLTKFNDATKKYQQKKACLN